MHLFQNEPPERGHGPSLPLIRTPQSASLIACVTSDRLIGTATHFFSGRTTPCSAPDCPACDESLPWRWHGYVAAFSSKQQLHFLFECTAAPAKIFVDWFNVHGTLRGALFSAVRPSGKPNGRVRIQIKAIDLRQYPIPAQPDVTKALAHIWNIPHDSIETARLVDEKPQSHVDAAVVKRAQQAFHPQRGNGEPSRAATIPLPGV